MTWRLTPEVNGNKKFVWGLTSGTRMRARLKIDFRDENGISFEDWPQGRGWKLVWRLTSGTRMKLRLRIDLRDGNVWGLTSGTWVESYACQNEWGFCFNECISSMLWKYNFWNVQFFNPIEWNDKLICFPKLDSVMHDYHGVVMIFQNPFHRHFKRPFWLIFSPFYVSSGDCSSTFSSCPLV